MVGIGPLAPGERRRRQPPGQVAVVRVVPGEQPAGEAGFLFRRALAGFGRECHCLLLNRLFRQIGC